MYHPGKVLVVFSPKEKEVCAADSSVQATVKMWDDNVVTFDVDPHIADKIKANDIVLVDYSPANLSGTPVPRMLIVKILRGATAKKIMDEYEQGNKRRREKETQQEMPAQIPLRTNYVR